ncbi:GHKL domain-containing protein [Mobilitalea sibirica]|uniref:GHKL domain-containing protein n=1 Tax=Mobilitalea sibirica TaxID=1462919 RepID=A0A8J7KX67_9FIRM|nr:GHKL domain-containing protein [Mobilitalea sibirica]MBH1942190.1 GHKL domain-containing protein [Mobilitalea sibirica]
MGYSLWNLLFVYMIEMLKFALVLWGVIGFKLKKNKITYSVVLLPLLFIVFVAIFDESDMVDILGTIVPILIIITISFIFQGKMIKKLLYTILIHFCIIFFDMCITGVMSLFFHITLAEITEHPVLNILAISFNIITFSAITLYRKTHKLPDFHISKRIYALIFAGVCTGIFFVGSLMITNLPGAGDNVRKAALISMIIVSVANFGGSLMLVYITRSRDNYRVLSQINQEVAEAQQRYYLMVKEKQHEIRSIRHEMKNHITCIDALYRNNQLREMHEYIKQVIDQTDTLDELFDTGNGIVNAILNDAQSRYYKEGINIKLTGTFPDELYIASMDLCVIFANAVTNAVEAIKKIKKEEKNMSDICIKIGSFKEDLFIDISNPIGEKVKVTEGKLKTSKKDKNHHGFGTANIRQRVEKYSGSVKFDSDKEMFYVHIHMINKQVKTE